MLRRLQIFILHKRTLYSVVSRYEILITELPKLWAVFPWIT